VLVMPSRSTNPGHPPIKLNIENIYFAIIIEADIVSLCGPMEMRSSSVVEASELPAVYSQQNM
jgi:hypothetical protein